RVPGLQLQLRGVRRLDDGPGVDRDPIFDDRRCLFHGSTSMSGTRPEEPVVRCETLHSHTTTSAAAPQRKEGCRSQPPTGAGAPLPVTRGAPAVGRGEAPPSAPR